MHIICENIICAAEHINETKGKTETWGKSVATDGHEGEHGVCPKKLTYLFHPTFPWQMWGNDNASGAYGRNFENLQLGHGASGAIYTLDEKALY